MTDSIELPPVLDLIAAPALLESLLQRRGRDLSVEAGQVQRLGAQCLQILLAARAAWAEDGKTIQIRNPSDDFLTSIELMGTSTTGLNHVGDRSRENDK